MEATGPFNKELIEALESMEMTILPKMAAMARWVEIVVVLNSALASFDTIESFTDYLKRNVARHYNPAGTAFVVAPDVEGASVMVPIYEKCYAAANWRFKAFKKYPDAEAWVKSVLVEEVA